MSNTTENVIVSFNEIMNSLKSLEASELFKLLKAAATEAEKKNKPSNKRGGSSDSRVARKKTGSMPKGKVPPQLMKPRAWVDYTLKDALSNGWEAFTISQTHKDKESGEKITEEIEMPASILHNGAHVFDGSVTDKTPDGKQLIHKEAMSLSKQRKESGHPTYAAFEAQYVPEEDSSDSSSESDSNSTTKIVVKKTAAEKEQEKAAAKLAKEQEKTSKPVKSVPAKTVVKATVQTPVKPETPETAEVVPKATVKAAPKKPAKVEEIPNDGMVHPWTYNGKKYLRNFEGETWTVGADGGVGEWAGLYDSKSNKLDTSAPEPEFEEDEN